MLAHTNTTRNVSVRACARVRACVTERWRERERRALTLKIVPSSSFFFVRHTRERGHFFLLWFPLSNVKKHSKKFSFFFAFFFVSFLFCLFYFLISRCCPYKKNHHSRRRRKDLFSSSSSFFFLCVCVFFLVSHNSNTRRGSQNIFAQKRKRPPFFSLDSHKKHEKEAL